MTGHSQRSPGSSERGTVSSRLDGMVKPRSSRYRSQSTSPSWPSWAPCRTSANRALGSLANFGTACLGMDSSCRRPEDGGALRFSRALRERTSSFLTSGCRAVLTCWFRGETAGRLGRGLWSLGSLLRRVVSFSSCCSIRRMLSPSVASISSIVDVAVHVRANACANDGTQPRGSDAPPLPAGCNRLCARSP